MSADSHEYLKFSFYGGPFLFSAIFTVILFFCLYGTNRLVKNPEKWILRLEVNEKEELEESRVDLLNKTE